MAASTFISRSNIKQFTLNVTRPSSHSLFSILLIVETTGSKELNIFGTLFGHMHVITNQISSFNHSNALKNHQTSQNVIKMTVKGLVIIRETYYPNKQTNMYIFVCFIQLYLMQLICWQIVLFSCKTISQNLTANKSYFTNRDDTHTILMT